MHESTNIMKEYKQLNFQDELHPGQGFESCTFSNCSFAACDLRNIVFVDCLFESCDFSMAKLINTGLKGVKFINCKLIGLDFSLCSDFLFHVDFDSCQLDYSFFTKKKMKKTRFSKSSILDADFTDTDLTEAVFDECNISGTTFFHTILTKADFRTAHGFTMDPEQNRVKNANLAISHQLSAFSSSNYFEIS